MASAALTRRHTRAIATESSGPASGPASRLIAGGATMLAGSVLADSTLEHYRGSFRDPAMVAPIASSAVSLVINGRRTATGQIGGTASAASHGAAVAIGLAGFGFHLYNVGRQPGGFILNNIFYKAPLGAPGALVLAGLLGAAGERPQGGGNTNLRFLRSPRVVGMITALGLAGTVAEAGLLHFRGAYHDPAMWLPVGIAPLAAISLARDVARAAPSEATVYLLATTAVLGLVGSVFHAYGVSRNMGGWRNWRQNLLAGPPLPAPPSFTGLAIAGIGVLMLLRTLRRG